MKEYIERDKLFQKALEEKRFVFQMEDMLNQEYVIRTVYGDFADFVNSIPAADVVEVKRGEWEFCSFTAQYGVPYICSECREECNDTHNFCPNCGADMREVEQ